MYHAHSFNDAFSQCVLAGESECSVALLGRSGSGVIHSYNYPFNYRHNLTCTYRIYVDHISDSEGKPFCDLLGRDANMLDMDGS